MKKFKLLFVCFSFLNFCIAQNNVGIGTPTPQQKLDVNGAIKIGSTTTNQAGSIRYNNGKFEGGDGTNWKAMEGLPAGTIVLSETNPNNALTSYGFTKIGQYTINSTYDTTYTDNGWLPNFITATGELGRLSHSAFYYDNKMIVIGGFLLNGGTLQLANSGFIYDFATNTHTVIATAPISLWAESNFAFTGSPQNKIFVWGSSSDTTALQGAVYDIATNTWTLLPVANKHNATIFSLLWTGTKLIAWGGGYYDTNTDNWVYLNTGKSYTPGNSSWENISTVNAPPVYGNFRLPPLVWTGSKMIVYGLNIDNFTHYGAEYNPDTDTWQTMPVAPAEPHFKARAVWAGTEMFIYNYNQPSLLYTPLPEGKWNETPTPSSNIINEGFTMTPASNKIFIWGGQTGANVAVNTGWQFNLSTLTWTPINLTNAPAPRTNHTAVWTGSKLITYGGHSYDLTPAIDSAYNTFHELAPAGTYQFTTNKTFYLYRKN